MEQSTLYELNLDFTKELNYTKAIMARQGDKGVQVAVNTYLHGLPFAGEPGGTFTLKATTPSGRYVDASTVSVDGNHIVFTLDDRFLSENGFYSHCYVEYRTANTTYTTQDITFFNANDSDISQGQADEYVSQLEELIRIYNETFDAFMTEVEGRVDSLNTQINDLTDQAKTLQEKLDTLKEEISKLGNLQVMYSNSLDFGDYDYSGNPNLMNKIEFANVTNLINTATLSNGGSYLIIDKTGATGSRLLINYKNGIGLAPTLSPNTLYTMSFRMRVREDYVPDKTSGIMFQYRISEGSIESTYISTFIPAGTLTTDWQTFTAIGSTGNISTLANKAYINMQINGTTTGTIEVDYNVKIERGSTATPYQPNLLDAPYYLSKVALGENIANKEQTFPIAVSSETLYGRSAIEDFIVGQTYVVTMKATKPSTQSMVCYLSEKQFGTFNPVEGLIDIWTTTIKINELGNNKRAVYILQTPKNTLGNVKIDWLKIEKGDTRTPNIEQYKYRGIGMRDSNNPKDYVWNLAPKYVEDNLTTDTKISEIVSQANKYTDGKASEINSQLTVAISAVEEKVNNNKVLIQKNKDRIIGGYRVNDLMQKTHYSAHRGNNADFPENSSMAMKKVIRHKFSEFDVQTTSDGKWVVMHDATVDRMTNGTGRVDSFTYEELRKLRIDTGNNLATLPDWEKVIPNLDEALKYNRMAGTIPMIEIKVDEGTTYTDEELADFVNQLKLNNLDKGGCIVISFSADVLRKLRSLSETLEIMWVTYDMSDATLNTCKELRMHVDPQYSHETVTRSQIQKYHDNGLLVSVWTCPDDKFADMEDRGVDIITTNSRSGDLKWGQLTLKNGFTGVTWAGYLPPCVEEITKGILRVSCTVQNGSNTQNTVIAEFPSWAQPYLNSAGLGMVRTTSTIEQCSVDVIGKIAGTPSLVVGLNWNNRASWAMINIEYKIL